MSRAIVKPIIDGGGGGVYNFDITEADASQDGEALVVVYSLPGLPTATVGILDGFSKTTGDTAALVFGTPLDPTDPGFFAEMRLGISFSCSDLNCGSHQSSQVTVNGVVITEEAGNYDDSENPPPGNAANGQLITVGGFDDPFSPFLPSYEDDHERYNLVPQVSLGDTAIVLDNFNASVNDNIFLAVGTAPSQVIANVHLARREFPQAIAELQEALAKAPGDSVTWTFLGDVYVAAGDHRKALESYRAGLKANPTNPVVNNNLAWVLTEQGNELSEALRLAQAATLLDPTYVDALDTLGWVHYRRGEYTNAVTNLAKASKLAPGRLDIAAHLGLAYAKAGSKTLALTELKRAFASKPPLPNRAELERVVADLSSASASNPASRKP